MTTLTHEFISGKVPFLYILINNEFPDIICGFTEAVHLLQVAAANPSCQTETNLILHQYFPIITYLVIPSNQTVYLLQKSTTHNCHCDMLHMQCHLVSRTQQQSGPRVEAASHKYVSCAATSPVHTHVHHST